MHLKNHAHRRKKMDKTEAFAEAVYTTVMETLYKSLLKNISINAVSNNKTYNFMRKLYTSFNVDEKEMFNNYLKSTLSDCTSTILADFDGISDTVHYPCEDIKILCDNQQINPWVHELFMAISQEKNPDI